MGLWAVLAVSLGQNSVWLPLNALLTLAHTVAALVLVFAVLPKAVPVAERVEDIGPREPVPAHA